MNDKRATLLKKYTPMTEGQLKAVVSDYAARFPGGQFLLMALHLYAALARSSR